MNKATVDDIDDKMSNYFEIVDGLMQRRERRGFDGSDEMESITWNEKNLFDCTKVLDG